MPGTTPISHWIGFHLFLLALLTIELVYTRYQGRNKTHSTAIAATILWVAAALAFALFVYRTLGAQSATQYLAGYAIEESLSIDNLFVFLLLFRTFKIEPTRQPRVLFWGVLGAILMRGTFIARRPRPARPLPLDQLPLRPPSCSSPPSACSSPPASRRRQPDRPAGSPGSPASTPSASGRTSSSFAKAPEQVKPPVPWSLFSSWPSSPSNSPTSSSRLTPSPPSCPSHATLFWPYTSNIMAVMGLRSLYFLIARLLSRLRLLHYGLAGVLAFAAFKMLAAPWLEIGPLISLAAIVTILGATIALSLVTKSRHPSHSL